jgi:uncharacterized membrane protein
MTACKFDHNGQTERGSSMEFIQSNLNIWSLILIAAPLVLAGALYLAPVAALMLIGLTSIYSGYAWFVMGPTLIVGGIVADILAIAIAPGLIAFGVTSLCLGGMLAGVARAVRRTYGSQRG